MTCSNCGTQNNDGNKFCTNCGAFFATSIKQANDINQSTDNQNYSNEINTQNNINNKSNNKTKIWAIISIIIPIVGLIIYTFIGLSFFNALVIGCFGHLFARRGKLDEPKLAKIGSILNDIFVGICLVMYTIRLIIVLNGKG